MKNINRIKLIVRILLPLLIIGIAWCLNWLYDLIVYGGFDQMLKDGLIDDASMLACHLFMGIFYFILLPIIFLIHALFCALNNKYNFINMRFAIIVGILLMLILIPLSWSNDNILNVKNTIEGFFTLFLPIMLYFYGLNATKKQKSIKTEN